MPVLTPKQSNKILKEKNVELICNPAYSPDLAPCDFCLFAKMKNQLCSQVFSSPEEEAAEEYEKHVSEVWNTGFCQRYAAERNCCCIEITLSPDTPKIRGPVQGRRVADANVVF
ncbi:hypothetical protein EVAR_42953_1 [Eumeta japonica]|uniref:Mariner Mos1 transposase n=1 Tax=Eumeta variegata TaxID=151549 RepID=A0A4C1YBR5_EUMVA|nr:hypothetical protein EVAR_42953_1 [Eumeta japonica]